MTLQQLPLPIIWRDDLIFTNFYPGKNTILLQVLQCMAQGKGEHYCYLWGQEVGCTHLLQACCQQAAEQGLRVFYLSLLDVNNLAPILLENVECFDLICIDDIQAIAGKTAWEEAMFHLFNRSQSLSTRLIIAGNSAPKELMLQLPDLTSRLLSGMVLPVQELEDDEKLKVLQMRAQRCGLELSAEVGKFLLHHLPRSLPALFAALDQLDQASLRDQRKLTIPFIKKILAL